MNYNLPQPKDKAKRIHASILNKLISDFHFWLLPIN